MAVQQLNQLYVNLEHIRNEKDQLVSTMPAYDTVMSMSDVGKTLGPQLIAEIGYVSRFTRREALTAFAGIDPEVASSGKMNISATDYPKLAHYI